MREADLDVRMVSLFDYGGDEARAGGITRLSPAPPRGHGGVFPRAGQVPHGAGVHQGDPQDGGLNIIEDVSRPLEEGEEDPQAIEKVLAEWSFGER